MKPCRRLGCCEWTSFGRCYHHTKSAWRDESYIPQSLAEALWVWGAREPVAEVNDSAWAWIDVNDMVAKAESRFDQETRRGIKYLVALGETTCELSV